MVKPLLLILFLISICKTQLNETAKPNPQFAPNFQGSFDSFEPFRRQQPSQQTFLSSPEQKQQQQQLDMLQFTQNLGDFTPDQTFTIRMLPNQKTSFYLIPGADVESIRGMFHCQISWNVQQQFDNGEYLDLTILQQGNVLRQYKHQRLGVFNQPHTIKDHKYFFHFGNYQAPIDIYFSYEMITSNKKKAAKQSNETQLSIVSKSFIKVNKILDQQQREMIRLMDIGDRHTQRIRLHAKQLYGRAIAEGVVIVFLLWSVYGC